MVEEFGDAKGVIGFGTKHAIQAVHHNDYMRLYSIIQETGKPLAFMRATIGTIPLWLR